MYQPAGVSLRRATASGDIFRALGLPFTVSLRDHAPMPMSPHLAAARAKVGHDLLTLTAASISIFDDKGRLLLGEDVKTGSWALPGGAIEPNENPADAAVRECFEETGLLVRLEKLVGVFGGPEFLVRYPNGDLAYYINVAFEASIIGGAFKPDGQEIARLRYFTRDECNDLTLRPASRVISRESFKRSSEAYYAPSRWEPGHE